jgi:hypothetical protein
MNFCTQERALIFRITHYQNLPWILANGLRCKNSPLSDPHFVEIGRREIISRRTARPVTKTPGGVLADYIPFYFNCRTPMLLNIKSGWQNLQQRPMDEIVILVGSLRKLATRFSCVFSDRNATLELAQFHTDLDKLSILPWSLWLNNDFKRDDNRPDKVERYMAEALIHDHLPANELEAIVTYSESRRVQVEQWIQSEGLAVRVLKRKEWYC